MIKKIEKIVLKYLDKLYTDCAIYPVYDSLYFKKHKIDFMKFYKDDCELLISDDFCDSLKTMFSLENDDVKLIVSKWAKETFKLKILKVNISFNFSYTSFSGTTRAF
jgi:hypothetical protein